MTNSDRRAAYDVITFDCYGTLIDWDGGITAAFQHLGGDAGIEVDARAVLDAYHAVEATLEAGPFRSYREVLTEAVRTVAAQLGWHLPGEHAGFLPDSVPSWTPFPDTNLALERLAAAGYRLGILSNVDDDILTETRRHFTVPFEFAITAQQVRSYKPGHAHFIEARNRLGNRPWLHAAQSYFHDVVPATELGIPFAWVNRNHEAPSGAARPDKQVYSLAELADWLT